METNNWLWDIRQCRNWDGEHKPILNKNQKNEILSYLKDKGETIEELNEQGWELVPLDEYKEFGISSTPNEISKSDRGRDTRIRYSYVGPKDNKNRSFCANLMGKRKTLYRREDIDTATNSKFGSYNIFKWAGSYNCRHNWVTIIFKRKKTSTGDPIDAPITDGIIKETVVIEIDKRNEATIKKQDKDKPKHEDVFSKYKIK